MIEMECRNEHAVSLLQVHHLSCGLREEWERLLLWHEEIYRRCISLLDFFIFVGHFFLRELIVNGSSNAISGIHFLSINVRHKHNINFAVNDAHDLFFSIIMGASNKFSSLN
jgi:hypothetical protein